MFSEGRTGRILQNVRGHRELGRTQAAGILTISLLLAATVPYIFNEDNLITLRAYAAQDTTKPVVTIDKPADGSKLSPGIVTVSGKGSDENGGSGVQSIQVSLDGGPYKIAKPKSAGDWSAWSLSFVLQVSGNHEIKAKATDHAGNKAWDTISLAVTASSSPTALSIAFANVAAGQTLSGTYDVVVSASDKSKVSNIKLYVDNVIVKTEYNSPYEFPVGTTGYGNGNHVLKAVATDTTGKTVSASVTAKVQNGVLPPPLPSGTGTHSVALAMHASWLSNSEFDSIFDGNLRSGDQVRYRVTDYPIGYDQSKVNHLKALKLSIPGLKIGLDIAYSAKIVKYAAQIKSQGFDFVEYNLENGFDGPNDDSAAAANVQKIKAASDAAHEAGLMFRVAPGRPNSNSFDRTNLLDDVAKLVDYYHIQTQSVQDQRDMYADFTQKISTKLRAANPAIVITSQISPHQSATEGKSLQQTMRDAISAAMSKTPPGHTQGAGMWVTGDAVPEAVSFYRWFEQNY